jgi:2-amino-1-hydroxyethylphosphonate dioxygenase (glycine-forming)
MSASTIVFLFDLYGTNDYIGEEITQTEHMIQTAMFAEEEGGDEEEILAALLHDIGHFVNTGNLENHMAQYGQRGHENIGYVYLKQIGFSERICSLARNHVKAKRYLVSKNKEYLHNLSEASLQTLNYQGGPMLKTEMTEFENDYLFNSSIKLRYWDDKAKIKNMKIKSVSDYCDLINKHINKN